ncbi:MAG: hypothetical protein OHK0046_45590 [Anaerolineae bacterium]
MRLSILLLIVNLLLVGCAENAATPEMQRATQPTPTEEPFYAPDFTLTSLEGEPVTLSDLRGRWVLVNFWATYCVPCRDEMPVFEALTQAFPDELEVLAINQRETEAEVAAFQAEYRLTFPLLLNPDDATLLNYQVIGLPQTLIVDPNGEIVWRQFGPVALDTFEAQLRALITAA